jgi:hypothetical protein
LACVINGVVQARGYDAWDVVQHHADRDADLPGLVDFLGAETDEDRGDIKCVAHLLDGEGVEGGGFGALGGRGLRWGDIIRVCRECAFSQVVCGLWGYFEEGDAMREVEKDVLGVG